MTPDQLLATGMGIAAGTVALTILRKRPRNRAGAASLDRPLLHWNKHDAFTMRQLLDGGICLLGRPGSGKTSFSGWHLANAVAAYPGSGGLILSSSPTDKAMWQEIFARQRRAHDLILFGPEYAEQFNFMQFLMESGFDQRELTKAIVTIGEAVDNDDSTAGAGHSEKFWPMETQISLETAITILRLANEFSMPNLHNFIINAAQTPSMTTDPTWRGYYHYQCIEKAAAAAKDHIANMDFFQAEARWMTQWPSMDNRIRSSIEAGTTIPLAVFNQGIVWSLLSRGTTITPKDMDRGKWIFVDASVGQYGSSGAFILNAWRYATQKHVLKRNPTQWVNPIVIWADEAGKIVNSSDAHYLTESRKYGGASVFLAQSMNNFRAALAGDRGKAQAEMLLGCFATKIAHAIGDFDTANWLSQQCGRTLTQRTTVAPSSDQSFDGLYKTLTGGQGMSVSFQDTIENVLEAKAFMHGLRTGGTGGVADAWILKTGESFFDGRNVSFASFKR